MNNYIEYNDRIAFHPGYYIKELVEESGLTQEDFAKRLDTTPKNLSLLVRGEQRLSIDIALKLSRMIGTSVEYWLNLQNAYDTQITNLNTDLWRSKMTIDEAIEHCKEKAEEQRQNGCGGCADDHQQLAEWLTELKSYKEHETKEH